MTARRRISPGLRDVDGKRNPADGAVALGRARRQAAEDAEDGPPPRLAHRLVEVERHPRFRAEGDEPRAGEIEAAVVARGDLGCRGGVTGRVRGRAVRAAGAGGVAGAGGEGVTGDLPVREGVGARPRRGSAGRQAHAVAAGRAEHEADGVREPHGGGFAVHDGRLVRPIPGGGRRRGPEIFGSPERARFRDPAVPVHGQLQDDEGLLAPLARRLGVGGGFEADPLRTPDLAADRQDLRIGRKRSPRWFPGACSGIRGTGFRLRPLAAAAREQQRHEYAPRAA